MRFYHRPTIVRSSNQVHVTKCIALLYFTLQTAFIDLEDLRNLTHLVVLVTLESRSYKVKGLT